MSSGRRRTTERHYSAEDQALDQISKEAEEKIQARRQARVEAREIRLREIERQQKEEEERQKGLGSEKSLSGYSGSRRGSDDSTGSDVSSSSRDPKDQIRLVKNQLRDLEEKYKAAMVTNAQLDNVKTSHVFQLELLKEQLEEQEEAMIETQREYKDKCREFELLKRDFEALKMECEGFKQQIDLKDKLIKESGLVIATSDDGSLSLSRCSDLFDVPVTEMGSAIISEEAADLLKKAGEGTLGKTDFNRKNDTCNVKPNQDSQLADPERHTNETKVDNFNSSNADLDHSEVSVVSETSIETQPDNNEIIDVVDKNYTIENDVSTCIDSIAVDNVDSKDGSRVVPGPEVSESKSMFDESDHESDENDVFYESKSELSPGGVPYESVSKTENELQLSESGVDVVDKTLKSESADVLEAKNELNEVSKAKNELNERSECKVEEILAPMSNTENDEINDNVDKTETISENETSDDKCSVREKEYKSEVGEAGVDLVDDVPLECNTECRTVEPGSVSGTANATGGLAETDKDINSNDSDVQFCIDDSDAVISEPVSESLEKNRNDIDNTNADSDNAAKLGDDLDGRHAFASVTSCISLESDVTYHSESEDEENVEQNVGKSIECQQVMVDPEHSNKDNDKHERDLEDVFVGIGVSADKILDGAGLQTSRSAIPLCSSISSESELDDNFGLNKQDERDKRRNFDDAPVNKDSVILDVSGFVSECDGYTSLGQSDDVFLSLCSPLDDLNSDISINTFARDYVKGVIQKSLDVYNKGNEQDKMTFKKQSITAEDIEISVSKRHYSEELLESASNVFTKKMSSGSVEILSPFLGVPSVDNSSQEFFSCKVEADLDVVKEDSESVSVDPKLSSISGFAVCYTGLEGISNVDSDSDVESNGDKASADSEPSEVCPDFTIMPMNILHHPNASVSVPNIVEDKEKPTNQAVAKQTNDDVPMCVEDRSPEEFFDASISSTKDNDTHIEDESRQIDSIENKSSVLVETLENTESKKESDGESLPIETPEVDNGSKDENIQMDSSDVEMPESRTSEPVDGEKEVENVEENLLRSLSLDDKAGDCTNCEDQPSDVENAIEDQVSNSEGNLDESKSETPEAAVGDKEVRDKKDEKIPEIDSTQKEDMTEVKGGIILQGAHGGLSDDDDDDDGSGISLSDDDILAVLEKCDDNGGVKDTTEVTEEKYKAMDHNEKKRSLEEEKGDEDIWIKKEISDKSDGEKQGKTRLSSKSSGDRKSGELLPTEEEGQDLESVLSRKQSKKKSKKKNSKEKEECLLS